MNKNIKTLGIIPARYGSKRFPGKPLTPIKNKPMIQWVYQGVEGVFEYLVVATDDQRIKEAVEAFGGNVILTSAEHQSGTDRCNEVLSILEKEQEITTDLVVNVQGDEPLIKEEQIGELISCFKQDKTDIATLVTHFPNPESISDTNAVKVVVNNEQEAMYFSRQVIPFTNNKEAYKDNVYLKHVGIYAYRSSVLKAICKLERSKLEILESLEQLRWIENGYIVKTRFTEYQNIGIDTPEDLHKLLEYIDL